MEQPHVVIIDGLAVTTQILAGESAQLITFGLEFVALDCGGAVLFGSFVVLEFQLGQSAEEVGIREIGLCLDGLVEVLDGQHVVVHRQHIAADGEYLLGIHLRECRKPPCKQNDRQGNSAFLYQGEWFIHVGFLHQNAKLRNKMQIMVFKDGNQETDRGLFLLKNYKAYAKWRRWSPVSHRSD